MTLSRGKFEAGTRGWSALALHFVHPHAHSTTRREGWLRSVTELPEPFETPLHSVVLETVSHRPDATLRDQQGKRSGDSTGAQHMVWARRDLPCPTIEARSGRKSWWPAVTRCRAVVVHRTAQTPGERWYRRLIDCDGSFDGHEGHGDMRW